MSGPDFAILLQREPALFDYAGLVLEMLGYTRWRATGEQQGAGVMVRQVHRDRLGDIPDTPSLLELSGSPDQVPLPCELRLDPRLEDYCGPAVGLYCGIETLNGIGGIRRPISVPLPFWCRRSQLRRAASAEPWMQVPAAPTHAFICEGEPLVWTKDGRPVVARRGHAIILGLPLISILADHLVVPVLDGEQYRFSEPVHHLLLLLHALVEMIAPPGTLRVLPWPHDARGVVSVRHDLDRMVDLPAACRQLHEVGIRPSMQVLSDKLPNSEGFCAIREIGGEIALHGRRLDAMAQERKTVEAAYGEPVAGHTAHGGADADGWQGYTNLFAAHSAGMEHTELLSEMHIWPGRVPDLRTPGDALGPIVLPHHLSFDLSKTENNAERLAKQVGPLLANRGHLTLMNHPDINFPEFLRFWQEHVPRDLPVMTMTEVARWWRRTHVADVFDGLTISVEDGRRLRIKGSAREGQEGAVLAVRLPDGARPGNLRWKNVEAACFVETPVKQLRFTLTAQSRQGVELELVW